MPQIKGIAQRFADQPVVVFGMNIDREEKDAELVIEKMELNYPTLKATGIPEQYKVSAYPTLIIIDQQGRIHDLHIGYSATLGDEVAAVVSDLLRRG